MQIRVVVLTCVVAALSCFDSSNGKQEPGATEAAGQSEDDTLSALSRLLDKNPSDAIQPLVGALGSGSTRVRISAEQHLMEFVGTPHAAQVVQALAAVDLESAGDETVESTLRVAARFGQAASALSPQVLDIIRTRNLGIAQAAVRALAAISRSPTELLDVAEGRPSIAFACIYALVEARSVRASAVLATACKSKHAAVRRNTFDLVESALLTKPLEDALVAAFRHDSLLRAESALRASVIGALHDAKGSAAHEVVVERLGSDVAPIVRLAAVSVLGTTGKGKDALSVASRKDSSPYVRLSATIALAALSGDHRRALALAKRELRNVDEGVRAMAVHALQQIATRHPATRSEVREILSRLDTGSNDAVAIAARDARRQVGIGHED